MSTVIGLFPSNQDIRDKLKKIEEAGFTQEDIRVISKERPIKTLLGCEPNRLAAKYASWGALLGMAVYGFFLLFAAWSDTSIYPISQSIAFEIVLVGILIGAIVGGIMGVFIGLAEYEKDTHLYTQGINCGERVFVLQAETGNVEKAMEILDKIGCLGVRELPQLSESI